MYSQLAAPVRNREDEDRIRDREQAAADIAHGTTQGTRASLTSAGERPEQPTHTPASDAALALGLALDPSSASDLSLVSEVDEDEVDFIVAPLDDDRSETTTSSILYVNLSLLSSSYPT